MLDLLSKRAHEKGLPGSTPISLMGSGATVCVQALLLELWRDGPSLLCLPEDQDRPGRGGGKRQLAEWRGSGPASSAQAPLPVECRTTDGQVVQVDGTVNGRPCRLTVDTGAERTFLRKKEMVEPVPPVARQRLCSVTGDCAELRGPVETRIGVGAEEEELPAYVADIEDSCLLSLDFLVQSRAQLDFGDMAMRIRDTEVPLEMTNGPAQVVVAKTARIPPESEISLQCKLSRRMEGEGGLVEPSIDTTLPDGLAVGRTLVKPGEEEVTVVVANLSRQERKVRIGDTVGACEEVERSPRTSEDDGAIHSMSTGVPEHLQDLLERSVVMLDREHTTRVAKLLREHADVFSNGDLDLGRTDLVKHRIDTGNSHPIKQPARRIAPARRQEMEATVGELISQGVVERSNSPWSSAVVLVKKKDGTTRCCVDYRALNDVTVKDSYPLPRVDDTLDALVGAQWFSTLDLKSGYHQVEMAEEDKEKTAFTFGQGLWQFRVMSFGLCNAPATFERLMERVLDGLQWKTALVYLDDVIVFGRTIEEEIERLEVVLQRFRAANLKLSPKKCLLFQKEVPFLGHIVGQDGVRADPQKIVAVKEWPVPRNVTEVRSYLGLCTYYRRFVKDFASIASPLHQLTRKGATFHWDGECQASFERLKAALVEAPVLPYPDPRCPYVLDCDASAEGVGAVLSQEKEGQERVVAYFSQKFSQPERNYCVTRKELLAVVKSLDHFHPYLYGAKFVVRTDHAALRWLKTLKNPEGQLARWIGKIEQHDYRIEHRPGRVHNNADSLSRRPCEADCRHCGKKEVVESCKRTTVRMDETHTDQHLRNLQQEDPDVGPIVAQLAASTDRPTWEEIAATSPITKHYWEQWDVLRLEGGVLQRRWTTPDGRVRFWQTVAPKQVRAQLLREAHDGITSGHLGVKKTLSRLRQRFYWVGLRKDVEEWCRACDVCSAKKGPGRRTRAPLQLYQVGAPMERVAVDIAGPLPLTAAGNRYVCVAMDYFTKWPEAYALPNHEATTVAEVLVDQFFSRFGVPGELHSDQGREFESEVFQECCKLLGTRKTRTTPLRPQSDGMVEKFNWTLAQELAKYCGEHQSQWDEKLPALLMAYRSAEHEATGYTPARLMLGRELRLPMDLVTGRPPDDEAPTVRTEYAVALQERLTEVHHQVRNNLQFAGEAMKRQYDRRTRTASFVEGDQVWLHNPCRRKGLSPKLQSPWEGPYTVVEKITEVTFRIRGGVRARPKVVHVDRLWRYHGPGHYTWGSDENQPSEEVRPEAEGADGREEGEDDAGDTVAATRGVAEDGAGDPGVPFTQRETLRPQRRTRRPGRFADYEMEF